MERESILIEADDLLGKIEDKDIRIFDATVNDDVYLKEHIPGAAYFDHESFSVPDSRYACTILPVDKLAKQIGHIGISNDSEVIVYACGMIPFAARAWWVLRYAGHNNVRLLNGGLSAWKNAGGKIEQTSRNYEPAFFRANPKPEMFVSKEEVMAALEDSRGHGPRCAAARKLCRRSYYRFVQSCLHGPDERHGLFPTRRPAHSTSPGNFPI